MTSVIAGLAGGMLATVVMTAVMKALGDGGPPPTANLVAKFADGEAEDHRMPGMLLHVLYGTGAGVVFAVGIPLLGPGLNLGSTVVAVGLGFAYGVVLMVGGVVLWMRLVIGIEPDKDTMKTFGMVHVVYGVVLGAVVWGWTAFLV